MLVRYPHKYRHNLRADDGKDECSPRQVAVGARRFDPDSPDAVTRATGSSTIGSRQDCDSNEAADEEQVEDDPDPSENLGPALLEDKLQEHGDEGVCDSCGQDAHNGSIGCGGSVDKADDLGEASGEEAERDGC